MLLAEIRPLPVEGATHQADENKDKLDDVSVRHGVQAPHQRVGDGHGGRNPDAHSVGEIQDHTHSYACYVQKLG